jgi:hypothetical protein
VSWGKKFMKTSFEEVSTIGWLLYIEISALWLSALNTACIRSESLTGSFGKSMKFGPDGLKNVPATSCVVLVSLCSNSDFAPLLYQC